MEKKIVSVAVIVLFMLLVFSGCTEQQDSPTNTDHTFTAGTTETFSVNSTGGEFSLFNDNLKVNVPSGSVPQNVDITVSTIESPVDDPSLAMIACFDFGPDGQTFAQPIELIVYYTISELPAGVDESTIAVYVLNGSAWQPIEGSFVNQIMHYAVADVSHFSIIACFVRSSSGTGTNGEDSDDGSDDDGNDSAAQYWFKADMYFYDFKTLRLVNGDDDDTYTVGVSAYWDPVSYAQYYQIKFEFHGNPPKDYGWGFNFREQGNNYCLPSPSALKEGYIYHVGGDPNVEGFLSLYDASEVATEKKYNTTSGEMESYEYGRLRPVGAPGFSFMSVYDAVEDSEGFSDITLGTMVGEMQTYIKGYVNGWDIWVRAVTERGD